MGGKEEAVIMSSSSYQSDLIARTADKAHTYIPGKPLCR